MYKQIMLNGDFSHRMSLRADTAVKTRQQLENGNSRAEEQCDKLENQLKEDKFTMAESERKYEDIARKLTTMEGELERSNERCVITLNLIVRFGASL